MGDDFIAAFHSLIRPFVGPITDSSKRELRTILGVQFQSVMKNRREELARIAASINRSEKLKSMILPMEQIYISSHTKYWDMMEVEIGKHNLQTETQSVLKAAPVPSVVTPHTGRGTKVVLLEECRKECERRSLPKGKTIRLDEKYSIATAIGMQGVPRVEKFKPGDKAYHRMSKMLSELGYCRKGASKFTD
jgi:hypothetical protein